MVALPGHVMYARSMNNDTKNEKARINHGDKVRLVSAVYGAEEVGTLALAWGGGFFGGQFTHEDTYGTWTITREDGSRYRAEGRLYLMR